MDGGGSGGWGGAEGPKRHLKAQTGLQASFKSRYSSFTTSQPEITIRGPAFVFLSGFKICPASHTTSGEPSAELRTHSGRAEDAFDIGSLPPRWEV